MLKAEKKAKTPSVIAFAAADIAAEISGLLGVPAGWTVTCVAPGHSREDEAWSTLLARAVAACLAIPFEPLFKPRPVSGSSHPRQNLHLPPLEWADRPRGPTLLVDDVATSGWHLAEGLAMLRGAGIPALGAAWIGGTSQERAEEQLPHRPVTHLPLGPSDHLPDAIRSGSDVGQ